MNCKGKLFFLIILSESKALSGMGTNLQFISTNMMHKFWCQYKKDFDPLFCEIFIFVFFDKNGSQVCKMLSPLLFSNVQMGANCVFLWDYFLLVVRR